MRSDLDLEIGLPQRILTTFLYFLLSIRAPRKKKKMQRIFDPILIFI